MIALGHICVRPHSGPRVSQKAASDKVVLSLAFSGPVGSSRDRAGGLGAALYETKGDGLFVDPSPELAALFTGVPDPERLRDVKVVNFYVHAPQREDFLRRVRAAEGSPVSDCLLLRLPEGLTWCRCRSVLRSKKPERYAGVIVALEERDDWRPDSLLLRVGWKYARLLGDGTITYVGPPTSDGDHVLVGDDWCSAMWSEPQDGREFLERLRATGAAHAARVSFKAALGSVDVQLRGESISSQSSDTLCFDILWRELEVPTLSSNDAALETLSILRERTNRLDDFEREVVKTLGKHTELACGGYWRRDLTDKVFGLRACTGPKDIIRVLPSTLSMAFAVEGESGPNLALLLPEGISHSLVALRSADSPNAPIQGFLWFAYRAGSDSEHAGWLRAFSAHLGPALSAAETLASLRAARRLWDQLVLLLLQHKVTDDFYDRVRTAFCDELKAEGASVFEYDRSQSPFVLRLRATTGIAGVSNADMSQVTYEADQGLTGVVATKGKPFALVNHDSDRESLELAVPRYLEANVTLPLTSWLGCPISRPRESLPFAFVRIVNRRPYIKDSPHRCVPFSEGDLAVAEELARVAGEFHSMQENSRDRQQAIARSTHELRAPTVSIRSNAAYIRKSDREIPRHVLDERLTSIFVDADILLNLIDSVDLATSERSPDPRFLSLIRHVIRPIKFGLTEFARRHGYSGLTIDGEEALGSAPNVWADPAQLRQVFYNLLTNAIKYGPVATSSQTIRVEVEARRQARGYVISVRDRGMGIDDEDVDKVFREYYRADAAIRRNPSSTGLGLSVVRRLLTGHGGKIQLTRRRDPTEFTILLPQPSRGT